MIANTPEIILLCQDADFITAFKTAQQEHWPELPSKLTITPINSRLNRLDPSVTFDLIVSPANSYGRLDGAFDDAISLAFSPRDDYEALMRAVQLKLYEKWRGFAPPPAHARLCGFLSRWSRIRGAVPGWLSVLLCGSR
ncbi:hypothetical protein IFM46972_02115 [Aspergillus udagawae]|uniref:ADP-ribose 1''-phosphate phosphatase n=1 Tax=Aspergillus udagawae TaxID=91492 RepID=A0A8H3RJR5_9EURO|nr:hypothetical protein IFM46972_02115 [Aspergillus udagawae]